MTIAVVFDPPLPSDSPATFNTKSFTLLGDLNTWSTQANSTASAVGTDAATATTQAGIATTQAGLASGSATTATTQAGIATTKASDALASANAAAASAASITSVEATTHAATSKTPIVDADELPIVDSAASWGLKKLTWANLKATLATWLAGGTVPLSVTTLAASGNVTLGDASADTLNVGNGGIIKDASGNVGLGVTPQAGAGLHLAKDITGATTAHAKLSAGVIQSDVTTLAAYNTTLAATAAAAFTLPDLHHYRAVQATFGAGSIVTSQYGHSSDASLVGATKNYGFYAGNTAPVGAGKTAYGFYSAVNVASGGGTTWGLYAAGNANNFMAGSLFCGSNVLINSVSGLGYSAGAGGTVTQATSRTTGVTLNKPTGAITLFTAAGSATAASFTVTNNMVAATDVPLLSVKSGTNKYLAFVTAVAAGSFEVTFYTTGGTASDAPVINFIVPKGVSA